MTRTIYVASSGSDSDYRVTGVFSTYEGAAGAGDNPVFITVIDNPEETVGAWGCLMCESPTSAWYSEPADLHVGGIWAEKELRDRKFAPGDVIDIRFYDGVPVEVTPVAGNRTITAYGRSKDAAIRAARDFLELRKLSPWFANAWWPQWAYGNAPTKPHTETGWAHLDNQTDGVQATASTELAALEKAVRMAGTPTYEHRFSSNTASGRLSVWVRQDSGITSEHGLWK